MELDKPSEDRNGIPVTYNHYYSDNVQNARHATTRGLIKKALEETSTVNGLSSERRTTAKGDRYCPLSNLGPKKHPSSKGG